MSQRRTKEEYARSYDRHAARLYRFALYVLGDMRQAESAVSAAFVGGWQSNLPLENDGDFLEKMLLLVWRACDRSASPEGEAYVEGIRLAVGKGGNERLLQALAVMSRRERAALVLTSICGCDTAALRRILPPPRPARPAVSAAVAFSRSPA